MNTFVGDIAQDALHHPTSAHGRTCRETSALIETFTREHGRVALVARGARRPRSSLRAALQPFVPVLIGWSARGELGTLRHVETPSSVEALDGRALLSGLYLNELLMRLLHRNDPHPELFDAYTEALQALRTDDGAERALRRFEKRTLDAVGYGMMLEHEADSGAPVQCGQRYAYHPQHGPMRPGTAPGDAVEVCGDTLLALAADAPLDDDGLREAKRLMRAVIRIHLGDRPLSSRALFRAPE